MQVLMHTGGVASTNCYLIVDDATNKAVLFDAPDHTVTPILEHVKKFKLDLIGLWLTHGHFDHLAGHAEVKAAFPKAQILIHPLDLPKLENPGSQMFPLPFVIPAGKADGLLADGQVLHIGSLEVRVIHTPGHAPGHVCYHFPTEQLVIGGDLIICGAVGRTDLPDSSHEDLEQSIRKLYQNVPRESKLLAGHCGPTTLAEEVRSNPYVNQALDAN